MPAHFTVTSVRVRNFYALWRSNLCCFGPLHCMTYCQPQVLQYGKVSKASDVYAFGVLSECAWQRRFTSLQLDRALLFASCFPQAAHQGCTLPAAPTAPALSSACLSTRFGAV